MVGPAALTTVLLLAVQLCGVHGGSIELVRRGENAERKMRRYATALVEEQIERRQSSSTGNGTTWDSETTAACMGSLAKLNGVASNPAGMAVCYNLPFLDNSTGVFQADLRLYQVSAPTGDFNGIPPQNVEVGLQYFGASVRPISPSELQELKSAVKRSEAELHQRATMTPALLQAYAFVGQINKNLMTPNMNVSTLEGLLIPIVTLNATASGGTRASTTLSSDEATFVNGIFAGAANATTVAAEAAAASAAASAAAAAKPFSLPGTKVAIFPIGAVITGIWAGVGIVTVLWGTLGRMRFREHYRRGVARADKVGQYSI